MQAEMGGGGIGLPMLDTGVKMGWVVNVRTRPIYSRERDIVPILQELVWVSVAGLAGSGKFHPHQGSNPSKSNP